MWQQVNGWVVRRLALFSGLAILVSLWALTTAALAADVGVLFDPAVFGGLTLAGSGLMLWGSTQARVKKAEAEILDLKATKVDGVEFREFVRRMDDRHTDAVARLESIAGDVREIRSAVGRRHDRPED